jgi:hypothetical protein
MNLKLIVAFLVIAAVPLYAQAQKPSTTKVTKADAEKVVKAISGDTAKTQTYCDIVKLEDRIAGASEDNADELSQKVDALEKKLGPEYIALMEGLEDIDPNSSDDQEIASTLEALDKLCPD